MEPGINRPAFAHLALVLRKSPELYNQGYWGKIRDSLSWKRGTVSRDQASACGAVACLAGWAAWSAGWKMVRISLNDDGIMNDAVPLDAEVKYNELGYLIDNGVTKRTIPNIAREVLFGLTDDNGGEELYDDNGNRVGGSELQELQDASTRLFGGSFARQVFITDGAAGVAKVLERIALSFDDDEAVQIINESY